MDKSSSEPDYHSMSVVSVTEAGKPPQNSGTIS